ncbi:unnamed protein product [Staurois parvus]|uniref:Uncharacterized protein n=1 Tax=Staurois parvus TaxID=386267 RepID=A0ABN9FZW9_9NEOB|nr:unnamed protein product [Staurois parvus]
MGPLCPHPHSNHTQKKPMKGTRGISCGPLLTTGPLGQCLSFQMVCPPLCTTTLLLYLLT